MDKKNGSTGSRIKDFIFLIMTISIGIGSTMVISSFFGDHLEAVFKDMYVLDCVYQAISAAVGLILVLVFGRKSSLKCDAQGVKEGLTCGAPWIVTFSLTAVYLITGLKDHVGQDMIKWWQIVLLIVQCIMIGISEELIFRGAATELAFEIFGADTLKNAKMSIVFTSFVFGSMHLVNAIHPQISILAAAMQAVSAFGLGLVFGAIYYRSGRSIWPCVVYHALQDICAFVISGALYGVSQEQAIGKTGYEQALSSVIFVVWFFYLM